MNERYVWAVTLSGQTYMCVRQTDGKIVGTMRWSPASDQWVFDKPPAFLGTNLEVAQCKVEQFCEAEQHE